MREFRFLEYEGERYVSVADLLAYLDEASGKVRWRRADDVVTRIAHTIAHAGAAVALKGESK